ncbi:MAG: FAD-dependent oxidoreductase [Chloroflexota bacterium]
MTAREQNVAEDAGQQWGDEADVVVVGFGGAGAVTAIKAHDAGAEVLILEKQSPERHTPSTMMCAGGSQVADDPAAAAAYFQAVAFGIGLPEGYGDPPHVYPTYPGEYAAEITRAWSEGITGTGEFLKSLGEVEIQQKIPSVSFPGFPGVEHCGTLEVVGGGVALYALLEKAVKERGIRVFWETPGERLITDSRGQVTGVAAQQGGRTVRIKARRAVVLTTGGFQCDEELKAAFLPGWGWSFMGNPGNTGDGLRMAMGVGAALGHMHHCAARLIAGGDIVKDIGTGFMCPIDSPGRLLVDNYGKRYCNEYLMAQDPVRYHFYKKVVIYDTEKFEFPRIPSWFIFDEQVRQKGPVVYTFYGAHNVGIHRWSGDNRAEMERGWILQGATIEELAQRIAEHRDNKARMSAETLAATIARFNGFTDGGKDEDYDRPAKSLGALRTPPYYAIAEYPGGPNTEGGPIKNARSQVISIFGQPIPRLYAAGEIASAWSFLYQVGGNIAECIISGQAAGKNAAAESPWA